MNPRIKLFISLVCACLFLGAAQPESVWSANATHISAHGSITFIAPKILHAQEGFSCTNVSQIPQSECEALVAIYNANLDGYWGSNWLTTNTPCSWNGVTCSNGHVTRMNLSGKSLTILPAEIGNLSSLTYLWMSNNQLTSLPPEIDNLSSLTYLDVYNNQLTSLPPEIFTLSSLGSLNVGDNQLTSLPPEIGDLSSLNYLRASYNRLTELPPEIGNLSSLTTLRMSNNQLTSLPPEIGNMTALWTIDTSGNPSIIQPVKIITDSSPSQSSGAIERSMPGPYYARGSSVQFTAVPAAGWHFDYWDGPDGHIADSAITITIEQDSPTYATYVYTAHFVEADFSCTNVSQIPQSECEALVAIYNANLDGYWDRWLTTNTPCSWNDITCLNGHVAELYRIEHYLKYLPAEIGNLPYLTTLALIDTDLTSLPPEIGNLSSLTDLSVVSNQLTSLPPEIGNLSSLTYLSVGSNYLISLPPEIGNLSSLTRLDVSSVGLTSLPPEIFTLSSLTWLDVSNNQLTSLPPEIFTLSSLTRLDVGNTSLTSLPPEIGDLSSLTRLDVDNNQLTSLPPEIGDLSSLNYLRASYNQLTSLPPEIGDLSSLTKLDVDNNQLTSLPPEIGNMTALWTIDTSGNPSIIQPVEIITNSSPSQSSGAVERSMPGPYYARGSSVQFTAVPAAGWHFDYWDGPDGRIADSAITITIEQDTTYATYSYTAYFAEADTQSIMGNVDCDDDFDDSDVVFMIQYVFGLRSDHGECPLNDDTTQLYAAGGDLDGSGQTDVMDLVFMLQCHIGIPNEYCDLNAAGIVESTLNMGSEPAVGTVDLTLTQTEQTALVQLNAADNIPAVGTFELHYDSSRTRLGNCKIVGQGVCDERVNGVVHFTFVNDAGLSGVQPIVELTFDTADVTLTKFQTLTLADSSGQNLAAEVTIVAQDTPEQDPSHQVDESTMRLFVPLINR